MVDVRTRHPLWGGGLLQIPRHHLSCDPMYFIPFGKKSKVAFSLLYGFISFHTTFLVKGKLNLTCLFVPSGRILSGWTLAKFLLAV